MRNLFRMSVLCLFFAAGASQAAEYLVRFEKIGSDQERFTNHHGGKLELVSRTGGLFKWTTEHTKKQMAEVSTWDDSVVYIQPNYTIRLFANPSLEVARTAFLKAMAENPGLFEDDDGNPFDFGFGGGYADNPEIKSPSSQKSGSDPLLGNAWGLKQIDAQPTWGRSQSGKDFIVAVTDSGVDYNHEDLISNMWRNTKEIPGNGVDDDKNGYVDDIVGWDFAMNDNKPYDLSVDLISLMFGGGNPGHGTHVSGVIGATHNNGIGIAGVAKNAKIMALRFITEKGQGTTESAIKAIDYAVANGAKVINASWGGEKGDEDDTALTESIQRAEKAGVIFVAAAGNGRANSAGTGAAGYDNDNDPKPSIPATLPINNIISVAAIDVDEKLGVFSNWGNKTVRLGAPGVKVLSTVPGDRYQDTVIDIGLLGITAHWDGTSMAAPHVSGALALAWSDHPSWTYQQVVDAIMKGTKAVSALSGKVVTGGRLDLANVK